MLLKQKEDRHPHFNLVPNSKFNYNLHLYSVLSSLNGPNE